MLFDKFDNEAGFREQFVRPFLLRMQFVNVVQTHGQNEFGLDFTCAELHRVFGYRTYGVVVKHEKRIHQSERALDDILRQIDQAFTHPVRNLTHGNGPKEARASVVLVLNSGEITANARERISDRVNSDRYGANVVVLSGEQLSSLDTFATVEKADEFSDVMMGLVAQLGLCATMLDKLVKSMQEPEASVFPTQLPTGMLESLFSRFRIMSALGQNLCLDVWSKLRTINDATRDLNLFHRLAKSPDHRKTTADGFAKTHGQLMELLTKAVLLIGTKPEDLPPSNLLGLELETWKNFKHVNPFASSARAEPQT